MSVFDSLMAQLATFIEAQQAWAGPLLGLAAFGESLVIVGLFIPATALLLLSGTLVGSGALPAIPVLTWLIVGSILGDAVSYYLGRWAGPTLQQRWPLNRHRRSVASARLFFRRYGFASIFLGRFLGPVRSTIPLVAGMMRMRQRDFQIANVLSAIVWVVALLAPGYLVARGADFLGLGAQGETFSLIVMAVGLTLVGTLAGLKTLWGRAKAKRETEAEASTTPKRG